MYLMALESVWEEYFGVAGGHCGVESRQHLE
jgi:hypothetical protein